MCKTRINKLLLYLSGVIMLLLVSCEGRTGYYDDEQMDIIAKLTSVEWQLVYEHIPDFQPTEFKEEGWIYKFNPNGTGSCKWGVWSDGAIIGEPVYFRWTFTNDNFAVIYIDKTERFWLIDKLTANELWVYNSISYPVFHPGTHKEYWKFVAR